MNKPAAIYARVSSDRQKENQTITSQTAALKECANAHGYLAPAEWVFEDDGYSGASLIRPGLEALRDLAARGQIEAALVYAPDRLSRKYAYQVLLVEEFARCGVSLVFLKSPSGDTPEDQLLIQFQPKHYRRFEVNCASEPKLSTSSSGRKSYVWLSRRSWSAVIRFASGIRSRSPIPAGEDPVGYHPPGPPTAEPDQEVIFCIRGVCAPPGATFLSRLRRAKCLNSRHPYGASGVQHRIGEH